MHLWEDNPQDTALLLESLYLYKYWAGALWLLFTAEIGFVEKKNLASFHCSLKAAEILMWTLRNLSAVC